MGRREKTLEWKMILMALTWWFGKWYANWAGAKMHSGVHRKGEGSTGNTLGPRGWRQPSHVEETGRTTSGRGWHQPEGALWAQNEKWSEARTPGQIRNGGGTERYPEKEKGRYITKGLRLQWREKKSAHEVCGDFVGQESMNYLFGC